jgi:hypothetical protein
MADKRKPNFQLILTQMHAVTHTVKYVIRKCGDLGMSQL